MAPTQPSGSSSSGQPPATPARRKGKGKARITEGMSERKMIKVSTDLKGSVERNQRKDRERHSILKEGIRMPPTRIFRERRLLIQLIPYS